MTDKNNEDAGKLAAHSTTFLSTLLPLDFRSSEMTLVSSKYTRKNPQAAGIHQLNAADQIRFHQHAASPAFR